MSKLLDEVSVCVARQTILIESRDLSDPDGPSLWHWEPIFQMPQDPTEDSSIQRDVEQPNAALDEAAGLIK
ncbi:hypothetical protein CH63R_13526 [Colletotrichum higginsianum IMI 349063]|uniref:Uncharacterized protein n=1 Tax=Colletotrichum higginsianum (strain IMI 349063) TaxID=759273 RepID=A0A1B7XRB4_COLHI|nr:hypothetical protein CH63R_13526 [Colletotrichum higginsianum IMI 349063]OBR02300.1 hypothetical protein CH63R_13526 [Colletotrichum higginsianum IMI 349063]GJD00275.1 hypothetical protein ColKHC_09100 [Colletotrichum higginsianum]